MSKSSAVLEKASVYDKTGAIKREVEIEVGRLKELRQKYTFAENLRSIEWLDPDKLFKVNPDEVGEFFTLIETTLTTFGTTNLTSGNVYRNARIQIKDLKNLLRTAVDDRKSLAQKVDAPWERIGGFGPDKQLAKKIIYCFNYEKATMLPIFSNQHLRNFVYRTSDTAVPQNKYFSLGQEYEHYTVELIKAKNSLPLTKTWNTVYFARFLYEAYPQQDTEVATEEKKSAAVTDEQLDMQGFVKLLGDLQKKRKITGEQFREYRDIWMQQSTERQELMNRLTKLLEI